MNCSQHPPEISSQLTGIYFSRTSSNLGMPIRYSGKYGSLLWSQLLVLPLISIQDILPQGVSTSSSQPGNVPLNQKEVQLRRNMPTPTPAAPTMPSPANITGIFLDTTANRPHYRDSPPLAFDRCNRYTLSLAIEKKMNVCQSGPGQARMHH